MKERYLKNRFLWIGLCLLLQGIAFGQPGEGGPPPFWLYFTEADCGYLESVGCWENPFAGSIECDESPCVNTNGLWDCDMDFELRPKAESFQRVSHDIPYAQDFKQSTSQFIYCEERRNCRVSCDPNGNCESSLIDGWINYVDGISYPVLEYDGTPACPD